MSDTGVRGRVPAFPDTANLGLIRAQSCVLGILGLGLTLVLIPGGTDVVASGIDLSHAGTLGPSAAAFTGLGRAGIGDAACVAAAPDGRSAWRTRLRFCACASGRCSRPWRP